MLDWYKMEIVDRVDNLDTQLHLVTTHGELSGDRVTTLTTLSNGMTLYNGSKHLNTMYY